MTPTRPLIALLAGLGLTLVVMLPLIWLINTTDWGIALMLVAPFAVYGLIRCGLWLADWAGTPPFERKP